ncbi:carbohydrate ABC transporter permease [Celeribacter halophilus]|uniref:Multiple sugar transport system permease protein n=1 Tax=Celeribacter halophilus TaxID=576117 RepID=A0A1I3MPK5_9RHOB|nr:sugar ABC transporter permease [Celeribacter halophilus]PZX15455.1 multiple sugar transport system permease protein [Celeribacter halophilus]SFI98626.1 multiple sugar transport system permease protein [Celeribacter halophilus]
MSATASLHRRQSRLAYAMIAPAALLILLIYIGPMISVVLASATDYSLISDYWEWVGLDNYRQMFADAQFGNALRNTAIYAAVFLPCAFVIPLTLAISIQNRKQFRSLFEILYFMPVTSTLTAMALVWSALMDSRQGILNQWLSTIGIGPVNFLGSPEAVLFSLAGISLWAIIGFNMVLFMAGLTAIPRSLYDAAKIDGADHPVDEFLRVTWPALAPTSVFVAVTSSITAFKLFDTVAVLTQGQPDHASEVFLYLTFLEGFEYFNMGYAAALSVFFLGVIFVFALIQTLLADRTAH